MPIQPGSKVGPYQIKAIIGKGVTTCAVQPGDIVNIKHGRSFGGCFKRKNRQTLHVRIISLTTR